MDRIDVTQTILWQYCPVCNNKVSLNDGLKCCPADGSLLVPLADDPFLGMTIQGKYLIERLIGEGGWSRVYKASHGQLEKSVAIKILSTDFLNDPIKLGRFRTEATAMNSLVHQNIAAVHDYGVVPQPFIVMEFIEGETLEQMVKNRGQIPWQEALTIFAKICDAMSYAHARELVHRDLKPSNIMLTESGNVKVLDFGLVKIAGDNRTRSGEAIGTPAYMSPEQCFGEQLDERSDIYSLGCIMYEMLAAEKCFDADTSLACIYRHVKAEYRPLSRMIKDQSFPAALDRVVAKSLAKEKDNRYSTMSELKADLEKVPTASPMAALNLRIPSYKRAVKAFARFSTWAFINIVIFLILASVIIQGQLWPGIIKQLLK